MSLKVWLPLNGSLENIGISNVTVTNNDATIDNNGKIGKCYSFDGTDDYLEINYCIHEWSFSNQYSICFWIKPTDSTNRQIIGTTNYSWVILRDNNKLHFNQWDIGGNHTNTMNIDGGTLPIDTWAHCVITWNSRIIKLYINGAEVASVTATTTATNKTTNENIKIGGNIYSWGKNSYFKGCLNDVRIYDHCLSAKEVKEIAQGLILHYKLNNGLNVGGGDNILLNTSFKVQYNQTTGWDTNKNGTKLATSWGGYNSGVANQATVYHAHLKEFNGEWVYEYIKTADESWLGISQYGLQTKITAGKTYTFSWEEYHVEGTNRVGTGLYYYKTGATSPNFHLGIQQASGITRILNLWQKFSYTFTAPSDADYAKNMAWYIYGTYNGNGTFYLRHPKLEEGEIATSWTPTKDEMGIDVTKVTDSSGYGNDGIVKGSLTTTTDTISRYSISTVFNGTDTCIYRDDFNIGNIWSYSCWVYSDVSSRGWEAIMILNSNGGDADIQLGVYAHPTGNNIQSSANGQYDTSVPLTYGQWNHICATFDGTNLKTYINGTLSKTKAITNSLLSKKNLTIGARSTSADGAGTSFSSAFLGKISDVRIYVTVLSADDIADLYHTSANIDNLGRVHGFEISEIAENKFFKVNLAINGDLDRASNGVGTYSQSNCTQTYENNSIRIYRPPNLVHDSSTMHNMWGGVRIRNSSVNSCHEYNSDTDNLFNLQKGHTYVIYFKVKGQSSNAATSIGWTNQMGWSGGGLNPAPSNVEYLYTPVNFNGEMDCFYKFTINDEIVKTCTSSYSYAVSGKQYLSYNDFMYGFGYENTGTLGTDVYVSNYRLYDITDIVHGNISLSGIINFLSFNEDDYNHAKISKYGEMQSIGFIEK